MHDTNRSSKEVDFINQCAEQGRRVREATKDAAEPKFVFEFRKGETMPMAAERVYREAKAENQAEIEHLRAENKRLWSRSRRYRVKLGLEPIDA
jgi:hypothetical protein